MDQSISQQIVAFIADNEYWSGPLSFMLACAASIIGTNFLVPIGTILIATGTLVGAELVSWTVLIWAASGAGLGSAISFAMGGWLGPIITRSFILRRRGALVERAHSLFESYGLTAIFMGYFSGPLRAVVAMTAGVAGMNNLKFHLINAVSAPIWAAVTVAQGAVIGASVSIKHPLFLVTPIAAPILAGGISVVAAMLWNIWRKVQTK